MYQECPGGGHQLTCSHGRRLTTFRSDSCEFRSPPPPPPPPPWDTVTLPGSCRMVWKDFPERRLVRKCLPEPKPEPAWVPGTFLPYHQKEAVEGDFDPSTCDCELSLYCQDFLGDLSCVKVHCL